MSGKSKSLLDKAPQRFLWLTMLRLADCCIPPANNLRPCEPAHQVGAECKHSLGCAEIPLEGSPMECSVSPPENAHSIISENRSVLQYSGVGCQLPAQAKGYLAHHCMSCIVHPSKQRE